MKHFKDLTKTSDNKKSKSLLKSLTTLRRTMTSEKSRLKNKLCHFYLRAYPTEPCFAFSTQQQLGLMCSSKIEVDEQRFLILHSKKDLVDSYSVITSNNSADEAFNY